MLNKYYKYYKFYLIFDSTVIIKAKALVCESIMNRNIDIIVGYKYEDYHFNFNFYVVRRISKSQTAKYEEFVDIL